MEGMFTNKNVGKKEKNVFKIFANTKILISTIHVKLSMFEKVFHWGYTIQK
jgi:hypothetical protein